MESEHMLKVNSDIAAEDLKEFEALLETCDDENEMQTFLENHTIFIPKHFMENHGISNSVIISKLPIGNTFITDFAFVSKCSNYWNVVLIEIEKPSKKIFKKKDNFSNDFNQAKEQIEAWKRLIHNDSNVKQSIIDSLETMFVPLKMKANPINFKYVLLYGRSDEIMTQTRKFMFNGINNEQPDLYFSTYDRVKTRWENQGSYHCMIATTMTGKKIKIKSIPKYDFETTLFGCVSSSRIELSEDAEKKLKDFGYDIDSWKNGISLNSSDGKTVNKGLSGVNFNPIKFGASEIL